jgi:hypothetical protein
MRAMQESRSTKRYLFSSMFVKFNSETGEFTSEKDWEQFDTCVTCRGNAQIDEMPEGDLVCHVCKAILPRPST